MLMVPVKEDHLFSERGMFMAKDRVKAPWLNYYDGVNSHLEYPDFSAYKLIELVFIGNKEYLPPKSPRISLKVL